MQYLKGLGLAVVGVVLIAGGFLNASYFSKSNMGGTSGPSIFYTATNATTSISTYGTKVFTDIQFSTYARITNPTVNLISCYLENKTIASSTIVSGGGILIGNASSTAAVSGGQNSVCFGSSSPCIPYIGAINCIATATSTVAITYK